MATVEDVIKQQQINAIMAAQAKTQQIELLDGSIPEPPTTMLSKAVELGRAIPRGMADTADFFTGLTNVPDLSGISQEQQAQMTPQDWSNVPHKRTPKIMDTQIAQDLVGKRVERGLPGNEGMDAAVTGLEFAGGGGIMGGFSKAGKASNAISSVLGSAGDYISNLFVSDDKEARQGKGTAIASSMLPLLAHPVKYLMSRGDALTETNPLALLEQYSDDYPALQRSIQRAIDEGREGLTLSQIAPHDRGIAALEKNFRTSQGGDVGNLFVKSDQELSGRLGHTIGELDDPAANVDDIAAAAQQRVTKIAEQANKNKGKGLERATGRQVQANQAAEIQAGEEIAQSTSKLEQAIAAEEVRKAKAVMDADNAAANASGISQGRVNKATTDMPSSHTSQTAKTARDEAYELSKIETNKLWDKVSKDSNIMSTSVQKRAETALESINPTAKSLANVDSEGVFKHIAELTENQLTVSPRDIHALQSEISSIIRNLEKSTDPAHGPARISAYKQLQGQLLELLENTGNREAYTAAAKATKDQYNKFGRSSVGKAPDEANTFAGNIVGEGNKGIPDVENIKQIGGALPSATKANMTAQFSEASRQGGQGFNASSAQQFIDKNAPALHEMGLFDEMEAAIKSVRNADDTIKTGKALTKSVAREADQRITTANTVATGEQAIAKSTQKTKIGEAQNQATATAKALRERAEKTKKSVSDSPTGKIASAEPGQVGKQVGKMLDSDTPIASMTQLTNTAKKSGPKATAGLRTATLDHVLEKVIGTNGLVKQGSQKTLNKYAKAMKKSGLFTPQEIKNLRDTMKEAQLIYSTGKVNAASVAPSQTKLGYAIGTIAGAWAGKFLLKAPVTGMVIGRSLAVDKFHKIPEAKVKAATAEILLNPKKFKEIFEKAKTKTDIFNLVNDLAYGTGRFAQTQSSEEQ